ncbi:MAG: serine/threonine-protein kinase [bacterium]
MRAEELIGRTIASKYHLDALIGKGGFGAVYRATHHPLGRTVAVKIGLHTRRDDLIARFVREAQVQAHLRHPACVMLLDFGEEPDGIFYMVQEYVDGRTLADALASEGPFAPARALAITRAVLGALHEAHRLGIVHRDIKPANIMLTRGVDGDEEVRVLDFGIAKVLAGELDPTDGGLTHTGTTLGTPAFMAPEQIRQGPIGPTTDIYAMGATLYRLCAGHGPFSSPIPFDILRMHLDTPPPPLPFPAPAIDRVIARAMEKEPADRYPSARVMIAALDAIGSLPARAASIPPMVTSDGETTSARGERALPPPAPPKQPGGRRLLTIAALVLAGAAIGLAIRLMQPSGEAEPATATQPTPREAPDDPEELLTFEAGVAIDDPDAAADEPARAALDAPATPPPATLAAPAALHAPAAPPAGTTPSPTEPLARAEQPTPRPAPPAGAPSPAGPIPPPGSPPPAPLGPSQPKPRRRPARPDKPPPRPSRATATRPPPPRPAPAPPSPAALAAEIDGLLEACECKKIPGLLTRLEALDAARAEPLRSTYEDECKARLPGNCLDR